MAFTDRDGAKKNPAYVESKCGSYLFTTYRMVSTMYMYVLNPFYLLGLEGVASVMMDLFTSVSVRAVPRYVLK